MYELKNL